MKTALITGITGQDGSYLAELLLEKGYVVHGTTRSFLENRDAFWRILDILPRLQIHSGDVKDKDFLKKLIKDIKPQEVYHLASVVEGRQNVFDREEEIMNANFNSTHYLLRGIKEFSPHSKFYLAGSVLMFGDPRVSPQNEETPLAPKTPYGIAKTASHYLAKMYWDAYKVFACTGILYNHESPRRDPYYLPKKITSTAARIKKGLEKELSLGNLDVVRDWSYAGDVAESMWLMLQQEEPEDYVIGSGEAHTVQDILDVVFGYLGLDWKKFVVTDKKLVRAGESSALVADISKARKFLGWSPKIKFTEFLKMMVDADLKQLENEPV